MVCSLLDILSSSNANIYTNNVPTTIIDAENSTRYNNLFVIIGASFFRGGRRITAGSTGSTPRLWLGGPSMRILMNKICIALSGLLSPSIVLRVISVSAAAAVLSWKARKFWML